MCERGELCTCETGELYLCGSGELCMFEIGELCVCVLCEKRELSMCGVLCFLRGREIACVKSKIRERK